MASEEYWRLQSMQVVVVIVPGVGVNGCERHCNARGFVEWQEEEEEEEEEHQQQRRKEEEEEKEREKEKGKYIIIYHTNHVCTISLAQSAVILHHFGQLEHTTQHCFDLKYCDTARTVALHDFGS